MADNQTANRAFQVVLIAATFAFSWLAMQAVHEAGHVLHAWLGGGEVVRVTLHPATISHTCVAPNPRPGFVAWGGPVWGCVIPLALWGVVWLTARRYAFLMRFFAGFCLITNGVYIGAGALAGGRELDGPVILAHGGALWQTLAFALVAVTLGFLAWNGLGPHFGLGKSPLPIDRRATFIAVIALVVLLAVELTCA